MNFEIKKTSEFFSPSTGDIAILGNQPFILIQVGVAPAIFAWVGIGSELWWSGNHESVKEAYTSLSGVRVGVNYFPESKTKITIEMEDK